MTRPTGAGTDAIKPPKRTPLLLRWGLPRSPRAMEYVIAFVVIATLTIIVTRAYLIATGFPQIGGDGLHVAHVLFGGLLMAVALIVLFTFIGSAIRPLGCLIGGIGFGLFIDEVGKFLTSDNNYFFAPSFAVMYATFVVLMVSAYLAFQRRGMAPGEDVAAAANIAVSGLADGLSQAQRAQAESLLRRAATANRSGAPVPGAPETAALVAALPVDRDAAPDPVGAVQRVLARWFVTLGHRYRLWPVVLVAAALVIGASTAAAIADLSQESSTAALVVVVISLFSAFVAWVLWIAAIRAGDTERGLSLVRAALVVIILAAQLSVFRFSPWLAVGLVAAAVAVFGLAWGEATARRAEEAEEEAAK